MTLRGYQVDAFTDRPYCGNPAGVIANAGGLSGRQMQRIAREFNNSETAFILPADGLDHDLIVRFFTPTTEVPSCGHATIAAHFVRALEQRSKTGTVVQKTGAGLMRIDTSHDANGPRIAMTQGRPEFGTPFAADLRARIGAALGGPGAMREDLPVQIVSTGHSKVMVPMHSRKDIDALRPDLPALAALSSEIGCNGFFAFCVSDRAGDELVYGRMFAPAIGIAEDPVTGNANGPVGAYLVRHGVAPSRDGRLRFTGLQGVAMGRPGRVEVTVLSSGGEPVEVTISGRASLVFAAELPIPEF